MSPLEIVALVFVIALFVIGIVGIVAPIIPSLPIIWIAIVIFGFVDNFEHINGQIIIITGLMALIGTVFDFVANIIGAKMYGASWRGMVGAFVGSIIGLVFLQIVGLLIGAFLGTFFGEYFFYKERQRALRAAWGTFVGFILGVIVNVGLAIAMIILFFKYLF